MNNPAAAKPFPIIAYIMSQAKPDIEAVRYDKITHINYSFVLPTPTGGLTEVNEAAMGLLASKAHAQGVKVGLAVGGWNDGDTSAFEAMAANPETRGAFIRNLMALVSKHDLDGIDIDWEYPKAESVEGFTLMMTELSLDLRRRGKFLSAAVIAKDDEHGQFIQASIFGLVDFLNIMAYDWHYQDGRHHSPYSVAEESLDYWLRRGCPKEKAVLGVPFYGRMPALFYKDLIKQDRSAADKDILGTVQYNGIPTMRRKTELAVRKGGGIMFWEITQDTQDGTSLLSAIHATVSKGLPS